MADFNLEELQKKMIDLMAGSPFATGTDISRWNDSFDLDDKDVQELIKILLILDFVVLRMGYGGYGSHTPTKDARFDIFWKELLEHPEIIRMLYWYFESSTPWEDQLEFVCSMLDDIGDDWEVFWLDLESINNTITAGFSLTAVRFLKAMKRRYPDKIIGLYANRYFYNDRLAIYTSEFKDFPFWVAAYPWGNWVTNLTQYFYSWWENVYSTLTKRPTMPRERGENDWEIWQVADKTGFGKLLGLGARDVDLNITRRIKSDFVEWVGKPKRWGQQPDEPEIPEDSSELEEMNVRLQNKIKEMKSAFPSMEDALNNAVEVSKKLREALDKEI